MRGKIWIIAVITSLTLGTFSSPASAQVESEENRPMRMNRESKWGFFVGPYGWLTGVAGTVVTDGEELDLDVPFDEFLERTSAGLMVYFEARRDKLFVAFDGTWAILNEEVDGRLVDLDIELHQRIYDIRVGYQVHDKKYGDLIRRKKFDWQRRGVIDLFVGGRYFRTEPIVAITPIIGDEEEISFVDSRVDPFIGIRCGFDMSYRWLIAFRGDIGGFGIGDAAQFSWQAGLNFGYRLSSSVALTFGYRILEYDTVTGEGEDRNGTDLRQEGPIIGAGIQF